MYIIGAGLAGLSTACHSVKKNFDVEIFEATKNAGGRCRSFYDKKLKIDIDNGNHLIFSANNNFLNYCKLIGSKKTLKVYEPKFHFFDLINQNNWSIKINDGPFPFWIFNKNNRIPDTSLIDYLSFLKIIVCKETDTISDLFYNNKILFTSFWEPLTLGVLNSSCDQASAYLLLKVLKKTFFRGGKFCKIIQPEQNWNKTLINPSLEYLKKNKINLNYNSSLKKIIIKHNFVSELVFNKYTKKVKKEDMVVLSTPMSMLTKMFPNIVLPTENNTILNIHFKIRIKSKCNPLLGMLNSISHWVFIKKDHISVTVSAANRMNDSDSNEIAKKIWLEISQVFKLEKKLPEYQVIKEKKATYNQSPKNIKLIREIRNLPKNVKLAGDWTQKNFPCTIESAILSGKNSLIIN